MHWGSWNYCRLGGCLLGLPPHSNKKNPPSHKSNLRGEFTPFSKIKLRTWLNVCKIQWWSITKYNYFVTVLKYIFQVSVLYWSSFILSNFYFYFTTFQSIRSYFLLHYISSNISLLLIIHHVLRDAEAVSDSWTNWFFSMNLFNRFANRNKRFIHKLQWSDYSCSRVENSLIQMIRLERVFFSELNSQVKNREILWARATDAVKSTLLMSSFRIHYCNWK